MSEWYRGWHIGKAFFGFWFQHPGFDPENPADWRHGYACTEREARDEIDRLLAEDAEWTEATRVVSAMIDAALAPAAASKSEVRDDG